MDKVKCDKCGAEMKPINPDYNCGMTCPKCGWGWATTPYDPMMEDTKIYSITLLAGNNLSEDNIKTVSRIIAKNYLAAKKAIEEAPTLLLSGKAKIVDPIIRELEAKSMAYDVSPHYPYETTQN